MPCINDNFFANLSDMEILTLVTYKRLFNSNSFYHSFICSTSNLVSNNAQRFFLFLQGEPLKPSPGEYSKQIIFQIHDSHEAFHGNVHVLKFFTIALLIHCH